MARGPCLARALSLSTSICSVVSLQLVFLGFASCFLLPAQPASLRSHATGTQYRVSSRCGRGLPSAPGRTRSLWTAKCPEGAGNFWRLRFPEWTRRRSHGRHARQVTVQDTAVCGEQEHLKQLIECNGIEFDVREAQGMEGDMVAQLRCTAFEQGEDMYHSQRRKMRKSPNYLLAGAYHTTFLVAIARGTTEEGRELCERLRFRALEQLRIDNWISLHEYSLMRKHVEEEWEARPELVVGSVDCSVHESFDQKARLVRWIYVSSMAVREEFRRQGLGAALLAGADSLARRTYDVGRVFLHVEEDNEGALRVYQRAGFSRADMSEQATHAMDRMLRLVLQVPPAAALYQRALASDPSDRTAATDRDTTPQPSRTDSASRGASEGPGRRIGATPRGRGVGGRSERGGAGAEMRGRRGGKVVAARAA